MKKMKKALALVGAVGLLSGATLTAASAENAPQASAGDAVASTMLSPYKKQQWSYKINFTGNMTNWHGWQSYGYQIWDEKWGENSFSFPNDNVFQGYSKSGFFSYYESDFKNIYLSNSDDEIHHYVELSIDASGDGIKLLIGHNDNGHISYYMDRYIPFSEDSKQLVQVPKDIQDKMNEELGFSVNSFELNLTEEEDYPENVQTICWNPDTNLASMIDLNNSYGVARVGDTFVLPYALVGRILGSKVPIAFSPSMIGIHDGQGNSFTLNRLYIRPIQKNVGAASVIENSGADTKYSIGSIVYPGVYQGKYDFRPDPNSKVFSVIDLSPVNSAEQVNQTQIRGPFIPVISPYSWDKDFLINSTNFGTIDIGCTQNPALAAQGLALLDSNGKFTGDVNQLTFKDVPAGTQFSDEISWLASTGITTGWPDGTYRPLSQVERGAMAAFFYRMAGKPEFTAPAVSPFSDVKPGDPFYKEITWMKAQGITTGFGDGTFRAHDSVNRDAMAAFFYRFAGKPAYSAPAVSAFRDIKAGDQFYKEVSWLASKKISTGWSVVGGAEFRPVSAINRDAMAAFIYRYNSNVAPIGKK